MGYPKALLVLQGRTMLERQLHLLKSVAGKIFVAGWPDGIPISKLHGYIRNAPILPDMQIGCGPLGGIYSALKYSRAEYNLFVSCDLPFISREFLALLCDTALHTNADVTVPKSHDRRLNPVCAVYRRRALPAMRDSLEGREYKVTRFFPRVRCEVIPWRHIAAAGFPPLIFDNINTPEDYERAKKFLNQNSVNAEK
jgi:molybdopterin-guanine dinucleotide biosynthesis protein A